MGITSKKKDAVPPFIVPYDPENIHLSRAQFIEKQRAAREKALKLKEYGDSIDKDIPAKEEKKKPKKIA